MSYRWLKWVTPNQLTLARMLMVPVLMGLLYIDRPVANYIALAVFFLASLTDYVDGELARFRGEVTNMGRLLDPLADKMVVSASLVMLVSSDNASAIPTILILLREFAVTGLRQVAALDGIAIAAAPGAKWKTAAQMLAIACLMLNHDPYGVPFELTGRIILWVAAAVTLWTGVEYFRDYFSTLTNLDNPDKKPPKATPKKTPKKSQK